MATLTTVPMPSTAPVKVSPELSHTVWRRNLSQATSVEQTLNVIDADHLFLIFSFLDGYSLARCSSVCSLWRKTAEHSNLWHGLYLVRFGDRAILRKSSEKLDWKQKFVNEPHLRFDGFYYLHASYWSKGTEASGYRIHRFSYYRYLRFFNDGSVHYALLNDPPGVFIPKYLQCRSEDYSGAHIFQGRYRMKKLKVSVIVEMRHMVAGIKVKISSTIPGAYNRLQFNMLAALNEDLQVDCNFQVPPQAFCFIPVCW